VRYKTIALPAEHGGWGLLFEPLVLGLVAAPSGAGAALAVAATGAFLIRHPLKLLLNDLSAGRRVARTRHAFVVVAIYAAAAFAFLMLALRLADARVLLPLAWAAPLALVQLVFDARNESRGRVPELCGAAALGAAAASIGLAAGWTAPMALALAAISAARTMPALLTVRMVVLRLRGVPSSRREAIAAQLAGLSGVVALRASQLVPASVVALWIVLTARGLLAVLRPPGDVRPQRVGIGELLVGLLAAAAAGLLLAHHASRHISPP